MNDNTTPSAHTLLHVNLRHLVTVVFSSLWLVTACDNESPDNSVSPDPLQFGSISDRTVLVDSTIALNIALEHAENADAQLEFNGIPNGAVAVDNGDGTATISWTPTEFDLGTYMIDVVGTSAIDSTVLDSVRFTIAVVRPSTPTSAWLTDDLVYQTSFMSDDTRFIAFSLSDADQVGTYAEGSLLSVDWQLGFRHEQIVINDQVHSGSGRVLTVATFRGHRFEDITLQDTLYLQPRGSAPGYAADDCFSYSHPFAPPFGTAPQKIFVWPYVYVFRDAHGDNYAKVRFDSSTAWFGFPDMGTVYFEWSYQSEAGNASLDIPVVQDSIVIGNGAAYFDFSHGEQVFPTNPSSDMNWDFCLTRMEVILNGGPNGPGSAAAHPIYLTLEDYGDLAGVKSIDDDWMFFEDFRASPFIEDYTRPDRNWFTYDPGTNTIDVRDVGFLIKVDSVYYKLNIDTATTVRDSRRTNTRYLFNWVKLIR